MAGRIFINYRRGDDPGFTQALYQRLEQEFSRGDLFMDVEGQIKPGDDFVAELSRQVAECDLLLAVIGPRWADLMARRASDPDDFVTIEIRAALDLGKRVIPVLVGGAAMPHAAALPESVRALARRNAVGLRPERFKADCQGLVTSLGEQLAAAERERATRSKADRAAAEAERQRGLADEAARIAAVEERGQAQTGAGLSPADIAKVVEQANWDFIKGRSDVQVLRDHLARYPNGLTTVQARSKLENLVWARLGSSPSIEALGAFLNEFPEGANAGTARTKLAALMNAQAEARKAAERRSQYYERRWVRSVLSGRRALATNAGALSTGLFFVYWLTPNLEPAMLGATTSGSAAILFTTLFGLSWLYLVVQGYPVAHGEIGSSSTHNLDSIISALPALVAMFGIILSVVGFWRLSGLNVLIALMVLQIALYDLWILGGAASKINRLTDEIMVER